MKLNSVHFTPILKVLILISALFSAFVNAAEMRATVDRSNVVENEIIVLTVEVTEQGMGEPDFSILEPNFEILGTQQSQSTRIVNGSVTAKTIWVLTLLPKQTGYIIIPSLTYKNLQSDPITIKIQKASQQTKRDNKKPVFVLAETDKKTAYVQEQINLKVQIFHQPKLYDGDLSKIDVKDAVVEQVGEQKKYRTSIKGVGYGVYEINYVIYPQASGTLRIPSFVFDGSVAATRRNNSFFSPFMNQGKRVREVSAPINIEVKPKPSNYPDGSPWLPAKDVVLEESWRPEAPTFAVGEPVTRSITIKASGQTSVSIPSLPDLSADGYKVYPDQAQNEDKQTPDGITGYHVESVAIVPTRPGSITLPAIKLHWWDTDTNQLKVSKLPERTIMVGGSVDTPAPIPRSQADAPTTPLAIESMETGSGPDPIWKLLTFVFASLWLLTLVIAAFFYVRRPRIVKKKSNPNARPKPVSTKNLVSGVSKACETNDTAAAKSLLINLAKHLSNTPVNSLGDVRRVLNHEAVNTAIYALEDALYKNNAMAWEGQHLATAIQLALKDRESNEKATPNSPLAPLHPIS